MRYNHFDRVLEELQTIYENRDLNEFITAL